MVVVSGKVQDGLHGRRIADGGRDEVGVLGARKSGQHAGIGAPKENGGGGIGGIRKKRVDLMGNEMRQIGGRLSTAQVDQILVGDGGRGIVVVVVVKNGVRVAVVSMLEGKQMNVEVVVVTLAIIIECKEFFCRVEHVTRAVDRVEEHALGESGSFAADADKSNASAACCCREPPRTDWNRNSAAQRCANRPYGNDPGFAQNRVLARRRRRLLLRCCLLDPCGSWFVDD